MNPRSLERLRAPRYGVAPGRNVQSLSAAARFVSRLGFCWLFAPSADLPELPSLIEAVKGRRGVHIEDWDADSDRVWVWKNELPAERKVYYGKALMGRPALISLEMLPCLLAHTGDQDFERLYAAGGISYEARRIYEALARLGPQPTIQLRMAAGLDSKAGNARYHRALDELQRRLLVSPVGATRETGVWVSQIFELTSRWFPDQVQQAARLGVDEARQALVARYLKTVIAARPAAIARLFSLPREQVNSILDDLSARRQVRLEDGWAISYSAYRKL